jgi:hypothetical protein
MIEVVLIFFIYLVEGSKPYLYLIKKRLHAAFLFDLRYHSSIPIEEDQCT